jgi:hypothetical protein
MDSLGDGPSPTGGTLCPVSIEHDKSIGELWLPWFVYRDDPARPVGAELPHVLADAQQLRVRSLRDERVRQALTHPTAHIDQIEDLRRRYVGATVVVAILPVRPVPEGWVLLDGCHRACALWRVNPAAAADLIIEPHLHPVTFAPAPRSTEPP